MLGVLAGLLQKQAGQACLDRESTTLVPDCFLRFTDIFMHLRKDAGARDLSDLSAYVVGDGARKALGACGVVPAMTGSASSLVGEGADALAGRARVLASEGAAQRLLKAGTWNASGGRVSAHSGF